MSTVSDVTIKDSSGAPCEGTLPNDLQGCRIGFDVSGPANGDVYRVEVFPDSTYGMPKMVEEIPAGVHVTDPQRLATFLTGKARHEYELSIHKVDATTAERDSNADAPALWRQTYSARA